MSQPILPSANDGPDEPAASFTHPMPILLHYWHLLLTHRWLVLGILGTTLLSGIVLTLLQTPQFTAKARIEIRRSQDNITNVEAVTPQETAQDLEFYQTQYALLEARSLAARVVRRLKLASDDSFFTTFDITLDEDAPITAPGRNASLGRGQVEERTRKAIDALLDNVGISPIRGSALVDVRFSSPDPALSSKVANTWAEEFIQSNLDRRFSSSQDAREFLTRRLGELRGRLEDSERELVTYAANRGIVTLSSEQSATGRTRTDRTLTLADIEALNNELLAATSERVRAESRLQKGVDQALVDNPTLGAMRQQLAQASAEYAKVSSQFGDAYPPLKAINAQMAEIKRTINNEENRIRGAARTSYEQANQREQQLRAKVDSLKGQLVGEQRDSIQYNIYQREVDTNRQLYDGLLQRFKEIGIAGVGNNNVSIIDPAEIQRIPSSPNLLLNILVSLIAGFAVAGATIFVLEQIDQSLKDPSDVRKLGLPLLGVIPNVPREDVLRDLMDRKSMLGEAYLAAQTNLNFLTDHGLPDAFMVTSTRPGAGKSTSALALSFMLGRVGKRTILVDADIRSPSINGFLDLPNTEGLSNYLSGRDDIESLTRDTPEPNLKIITTGPPPPNAAEMLSSQRFVDLLTVLKQQYDVVVIDAPPVLGLADVPLISRNVDGVIYTIETNGVKLRGIQAALARLRMSQSNIFGALVTKYDSKDLSGYGYGYAYGYGYGENAATKES